MGTGHGHPRRLFPPTVQGPGLLAEVGLRNGGAWVSLGWCPASSGASSSSGQGGAGT